jgi:tRNA (adenine57-N1/adenine58-N1)-methyltransferase
VQGRVLALREDGGKVHLIKIEDREIKVRGVGRINPCRDLKDAKAGGKISVGQKEFLVLKPRLREITEGMHRRAQIITPKDASLLTSMLGITSGDRVLELGFGSAGLSLYLANVIGKNGLLTAVELRKEHAEVGLENVALATSSWEGFPEFHLVEGDAYDSETADAVGSISDSFDAISIDLPEPWRAIPHFSSLLAVGGRLSCYCPVTSQLESSWNACEQAGLEVEWAGERIDRVWTKASKGGVRPGNNPMGHTAFVLVAMRTN